MILAGVTCYPTLFPKPNTVPALDWSQLESGRWRCTARSASADQYFSDLTIYDDQPVIEALWLALKDPTNRGSMTVNLGTGGQKIIFGAEVTCTTAAVVNYGVPIEQAFTGLEKAMYSLKLTLRAIDPTLSGTGEWPDVLRVQKGWKTGSTFEINKLPSINGTMTYNDSRSDTPYFEGEFLQTTAEMVNIRRFIFSVNRGAQFVFPEIGIPIPFGADLPGFSGSFVRLIVFEDMGPEEFVFSRCKIGLSFDGIQPS